MTLKEYFKGDKFAELADMELLEVGDGFARASMKVQEKHLNGAGVCQGGAIFTLADLTFAACVNSHFQVTVSVSCNIAYVKAVPNGETLYAEGHELVNHHRLPFAEVRVTDNSGDLVAIFTATGYRKKMVFSGETDAGI